MPFASKKVAVFTASADVETAAVLELRFEDAGNAAGTQVLTDSSGSGNGATLTRGTPASTAVLNGSWLEMYDVDDVETPAAAYVTPQSDFVMFWVHRKRNTPVAAHLEIYMEQHPTDATTLWNIDDRTSPDRMRWFVRERQVGADTGQLSTQSDLDSTLDWVIIVVERSGNDYNMYLSSDMSTPEAVVSLPDSRVFATPDPDVSGINLGNTDSSLDMAWFEVHHVAMTADEKSTRRSEIITACAAKATTVTVTN